MKPVMSRTRGDILILWKLAGWLPSIWTGGLGATGEGGRASEKVDGYRGAGGVAWRCEGIDRGRGADSEDRYCSACWEVLNCPCPACGVISTPE